MKGIGSDDSIIGTWPLFLVTLVNFVISFVFGFLNDLVGGFLPE